MSSACVRVRVLSSLAVAAAAFAGKLHAQGCEPIRFTTPVNLGGKGEAYQREQEWRFTLAYRSLRADQYFVGSAQADAQGPLGQPPVIDINTFVGDIAYSPQDRLLLRVSVPFQTGKGSRKWADGLVHSQSATGIGDISVMAEEWLFAPKTHARGNVSLGLGVKAPTGSYKASSKFWTATGAVEFPADQTVQTGDGGWAILTQAQGFRQLGQYVYGYANASYMVSPKAQSDVVAAPGSTLHWSVPDIYSASAGAAFSVLPDAGLSLSLGVRMDGIPRHDLIGGGDDNTLKRTSQVGFIDPGVTWSRGHNSFTVSVPWRVYVNRFKSDYEVKTNGLNGGGFARYLVFASYSHRL